MGERILIVEKLHAKTYIQRWIYVAKGMNCDSMEVNHYNLPSGEDFAIQLQGVLLAERLYLKNFQDPSHFRSQTNAWSRCKWVVHYFPTGVCPNEYLCLGVPGWVGQDYPICIMARGSPYSILLLYFFSFYSCQFCIIFWISSALISHQCYSQ